MGPCLTVRPLGPPPGAPSVCEPLRRSPNGCRGDHRGLLRRWIHANLRVAFPAGIANRQPTCQPTKVRTSRGTCQGRRETRRTNQFTDGCGLAAPLRRPLEREIDPAHGDDIAVGQHGLLLWLAIDQNRIGLGAHRGLIVDLVAPIVDTPELGMMARDP